MRCQCQADVGLAKTAKGKAGRQADRRRKTVGGKDGKQAVKEEKERGIEGGQQAMMRLQWLAVHEAGINHSCASLRREIYGRGTGQLAAKHSVTCLLDCLLNVANLQFIFALNSHHCVLCQQHSLANSLSLSL